MLHKFSHRFLTGTSSQHCTGRQVRRKRMRHYQSLLVLAGGITLIGCNQPAGGPSPRSASDSASASEPLGAAPTEFFNFCCGDVISMAFPAERAVAGPSGSSIETNFGSGGGTTKVTLFGMRRSTPAESEAMMRKLHAALRRAAQDKGCQVQGPPEITTEQAKAGFTLKYSKRRNTGEVVVTRTERTEKEYRDKDGTAVYTIRVVVSETLGKPSG